MLHKNVPTLKKEIIISLLFLFRARVEFDYFVDSAAEKDSISAMNFAKVAKGGTMLLRKTY